MSFASLLGILLILCSLHQIKGKNIGKDDAPWFCHDLDCPKFKVLETKDNYEVREYEKGIWNRHFHLDHSHVVPIFSI